METYKTTIVRIYTMADKTGCTDYRISLNFVKLDQNFVQFSSDAANNIRE
jgi:hypothetical protein